MAIVRNVGAGTARQLGSQLLTEGLRTREQADQLSIAAILANRGEIDEITGSLIEYSKQQAANRAARKRGRAGKKSGVGALIGTAVAVVAAPFTAGASLAYIPAAAGIGAGVGSLLEDDPEAGLRASEQIQGAADRVGAASEAQADRETAQEIADTRAQARVAASRERAGASKERSGEEMIDNPWFEEPDFRPESELGVFGKGGPAKAAGETFGIVGGTAGRAAAAGTEAAANLVSKPAEKVIDVGFGVVYDTVRGIFRVAEKQ